MALRKCMRAGAAGNACYGWPAAVTAKEGLLMLINLIDIWYGWK